MSPWAAKSNADVTYAWPGAVISALTPEAAVQVLYTDDLKADKKPALQSVRNWKRSSLRMWRTAWRLPRLAWSMT